MRERARVAVLISGNGSNLQALIDASLQPQSPYEIVGVVSNRSDAYGLARARTARIPAEVRLPGEFSSREAFDAAVLELLRKWKAEWVCLAGYMRLISATILEAFPDRILNIHPSLLPSFKGLYAVRQALEYGVQTTGCTVHWIDAGLDEGPIVAQASLTVDEDDTEETLTERIHTLEHALYPQALAQLTRGGYQLDGRRLRFKA